MQDGIPYIEVVGTAEFSEEVERYVSELRIGVRAAAGEVALSEARELRKQVIQRLLESGLRSEELIEGGTLAWSPWFWKKKVGQEAIHKIIVKCSDFARMMEALDALEPLFSNQRHTLSVEMQSPQFRGDSEAIENARREALQIARKKGESIAAESGVLLGAVIQVEELVGNTRRSGIYGDEGWMGPVAVAGAPAAGGAHYPELSRANRETTLRFRVRYAISTKT